MILKAQIVNTEVELRNLKEAWNKLVENNPKLTMFQFWEWYFLIYKYFKNEYIELCVVTFQDENSEIIGIFPLWINCSKIGPLRIKILEYIGGSKHLNHVQPIIKKNCEKDVVEHFLKWLKENKTIWEIVDLHNMIHDIDLWNEGINDNINKKWFSTLNVENKAPYLNLEHQDIYDNIEDKSFVKYLNRKVKKINKDFECKFKAIENEDDMIDHFPDFIKYNKMRSREKNQIGKFKNVQIENFVLELVKCMLLKNMLKFYCLLLDEQRVGYLLNFEFQGKQYYYQSGFNTNYGKYSIGHILHYYAIGDAIANQNNVYDFLNGDEYYKQLWTPKFIYVYHLRISKCRSKHLFLTKKETIIKWIKNNKLIKEIYFKYFSK